MPEVEELRTIVESGDISALFSQDELKENPRYDVNDYYFWKIAFTSWISRTDSGNQ